MLMHKISTRVVLADADLQIRGGGGGGGGIQPRGRGGGGGGWGSSNPGIRGEGKGAPVSKRFFQPYGPQFGLKIRGASGPPGPLTWIRHLV